MRKIKIFSACLVLCLFLTSCGNTTTVPETSPTLEDFNNEIVVNPKQKENEEIDNKEEVVEGAEPVESKSLDLIESVVDGEIEVKFIDVGQGDSALIVTPNNDAILIDTGVKRDAAAILDVLNEYDLEDIDLMVLTHPHADHIGGTKTILENYDVEEVVMSSYVADSKLFNELLDYLETDDAKVTRAEVGQIYNIDGVVFQVVGVDSEPKDCNNSSIVGKMTYGTVDIMFTGDAEKEAEAVVLNNGFDLNSEVLKVGHHGSDTSSSEAFLEAVQPKIAIISAGEDNKYGHPCKETLDKLDEKGIQYYRTDEVGTVTLEIDGENISTSLEDNFESENAMSGRIMFTPDVAEIKFEMEEKIIEKTK